MVRISLKILSTIDLLTNFFVPNSPMNISTNFSLIVTRAFWQRRTIEQFSLLGIFGNQIVCEHCGSNILAWDIFEKIKV